MTSPLGTRTLGRDGLTVSSLGLGCMGMSQSYGAADRDESIATVHRALDLGVTFLDTSDVYGNGHNEELVGEAIAGRRDEVQLATKFSLTRTPDGRRAIDGRPENVRACAEASLRRLRRRRHRPLLPAPGRPARCRSRTPSAPWPSSCSRARSATSGCRRPAPAPIRRAVAVHPIAALQSEWSLWTRDLEAASVVRHVRPRARDRHRAVQPARPRLPHRRDHQPRPTSPRTTSARNHPRFPGEAFAAQPAAGRGGARRWPRRRASRAGQLALAWVLAQGDDVVPIPGTKRRSYLEENVGAGRRRADRRRPGPARRRSPRPASPRAAATPTRPTPTATARSRARERRPVRGGARARRGRRRPTGCWSPSSPRRWPACCCGRRRPGLPHPVLVEPGPGRPAARTPGRHRGFAGLGRGELAGAGRRRRRHRPPPRRAGRAAARRAGPPGALGRGDGQPPARGPARRRAGRAGRAARGGRPGAPPDRAGHRLAHPGGDRRLHARRAARRPQRPRRRLRPRAPTGDRRRPARRRPGHERAEAGRPRRRRGASSPRRSRVRLDRPAAGLGGDRRGRPGAARSTTRWRRWSPALAGRRVRASAWPARCTAPSSSTTPGRRCGRRCSGPTPGPPRSSTAGGRCRRPTAPRWPTRWSRA